MSSYYLVTEGQFLIFLLDMRDLDSAMTFGHIKHLLPATTQKAQCALSNRHSRGEECL